MVEVDFSQGDYRVVAARLLPAAEQLVAWCAPSAGQLVVDVAAGSGNVAHLCTRRGANVVAVDLSVDLLRLGREDGEGVRWVAGDAHALPLADDVADAALSTFGLIYADRPDDAVRELARVVRPGGRIGIATWPQGGYQGVVADTLRQVAGDGPHHDHVAVWGTAEQIRTRLSAVADDVEVREGRIEARFPSLDAWWQSRATTTPTIVHARGRLDDEGFADLTRRHLEAARASGVETEDGFVLRETYLVALGRVR